MKLLAGICHNRKLEQGSNMVEFALVFGIASLLIFGLIDLSRVVYASTALEAAAQAGARYGITAPDNEAGIRAAVTEDLVGVDTGALEITITHPSSQEIEVELTYQYQFITPIMSQLFGSNAMTLHAGARMNY